MTNIFKIGSAVVAGACLYGAVAGEPSNPANPVEVAAVVADVAPSVTPAEPVVIDSSEAEPAPVTWQTYEDAYKAMSEDGLPMVVLFGMPGCQPCAELKATIEDEREGEVHYVYVDVIAEPEVAQQFGYTPQGMSVPQLVVYHYQDDGWYAGRFAGNVGRAVIRGAIQGAKRLNKRVRSVLRKSVMAPVKAVQWVREHQPVRSAIGCVACGIQERQPVRNFFRNGGIFRR